MGAFDLTVPGAIGPLRRQLLLARLFERSGWPIGHALRLADELAALLDELQTERVPLDALAHLVPQHLAEHWQNNRAVLAVIAEAWPGVLAAERALDPAERRHRLLAELADAVARRAAAAPDRRRRLDRQHPRHARSARSDRDAAPGQRGAARSRSGDGRGELAGAAAKPPAVRPEAAARGARDRSWGGRRVGRGGHRRHRSGARATARRGDASGGDDRRLAAGGAANTCGAPGSGAGTPSRSARRSARPGAAHARRARGARAQRRPGHARPPARPPGRRRAAPLGHRGRRFRGHAARSDPARRLPAADRAHGHRRRHTGRPARCAEASVRAQRPGPGLVPRPGAGARAAPACAARAWPVASPASWSSSGGRTAAPPATSGSGSASAG